MKQKRLTFILTVLLSMVGMTVLAEESGNETITADYDDTLPAADYKRVLTAAETLISGEILDAIAQQAANDGKTTYGVTLGIPAGATVDLHSVDSEINANLKIPDGMSITFFGMAGGDAPTIKFQKNIDMEGTHGYIAFENVVIVDDGAKYVINQSKACNVGEFRVKDSEVSGFATAFFRLQGTDVKVISKLVLDNSIFHDMCTGYSFIHVNADSGNGVVNNIDIDNCTLYNIATGGKMFIYSMATNMESITVSNTTFYNCIGNDNYWVDFGANTYGCSVGIEFEKCLFTKTPDDITTKNIRSSNTASFIDCWKTTDFFKAFDCNAYESTADDIFTNPANGDFTLKISDKVGDPRWRIEANNEPYAVLSDNNTVLTFYYDDQKAAKGGMDVGPFTRTVVNNATVVNSGWFEQRENIKSVVFNQSFANCTSITSTAYWFYECLNLESISDLDMLNTENVTDMSGMFWFCSSLTSLNVSNFNTKNVTAMMGMFARCSSLTSLNVTNFNTQQVTDMAGMFWNCSSLTSIDVSNFNTQNVTDMQNMFHGCSTLTSLNLSNFNTQHVTSMSLMFEESSRLTTIDVSNFNTQNVKYMDGMFSGCSALTKIYAGNKWTTTAVTDGADMFTGCTSLVGGAGTPYDANHTDHTYAHIDKEGYPGYFTAKGAVSVTATFPFSEGTEGQIAVFSHSDYFLSSRVTHGNNLSIQDYRICAGTQETLLTSTEQLNDSPTDDDVVSFLITTKPGLTFTPTKVSFKANRFGTDTGNIDVYWLYSDNTTIELEKEIKPERENSSVNTVKNYNITGTAHGEGECGLNIFLYNLNTAKNIGLADIVIEGIVSGEGVVGPEPYARLENDELVFMYDGNKTDNDFAVTTFNSPEDRAWHQSASSIKGVRFAESFIDYSPTSTAFWFYGMEMLEALDLSSLTMTNVTNTSGMFTNCSLLATITVNNTWPAQNGAEGTITPDGSGSNVTGSDMFNGCRSLKGGAGTTYDASHVDYAYAHIDGGTSNPGYFTAATEDQPSTDESNLYPPKNIVWRDITWKNANNKKDKDNNDMPFLMGSGLGYKTLLAESFYSEAQGTNVTRPYYTYIDHEAGEKGVPGVGLYYKFTPKVSGQLRFNTWVNKGNRKTFIIKASDGTPLEPYVDYTFDGYINGQNQPETGYPLYFTADEIKSRHDESGTVNKYVVVTSQAFWGWITVNLNAGESYYIYQQSSQLGFGGYDFTPVGGTTENYVSCIRSSNNDGTFVLSPEFAAVVDENGRAMNVDEKGSLVKFGTTNMDVEALGSATVEYLEADFDKPYAAFNNDSTVLTFYYDDQKTARSGFDLESWATSHTYHQMKKEVSDSVVTLFDNITALPQIIVVDFSKQGFENQQSLLTDSIKLDNGTVITFSKGDGASEPKYWEATNGIRFYAKNSMSIKSSTTPIAKVVLTCDAFNGIPYTGNEQLYGSVEGNTLTIVNEHTSSSGGTQLRVKTMEIFYAAEHGWDEAAENLREVKFDDSFANYTTLTSTARWFSNCRQLATINGIKNLKTENVTDMSSMFSGCSALTEIDLEGFNTANVTDMSSMFSGCHGLSNLDVRGFNTGNVTDMSSMFMSCLGLTTLDLSSFNTQNVTNMSGMFLGCSGLTSLDVSKFTTQNVTNMYAMFGRCSSLTSLDVSKFDTQNVTDMSVMFDNCSGLTTLDLSNFNTQNVTDLNCMFLGCSSLTSVDLSSFNTQKVSNMGWMFQNCSSLKTIYVGEGWSTSSVTNSEGMFNGCVSLVGGAGTPYDANHTDHPYAHIDGGESNPGYFSVYNPFVYYLGSTDGWTQANQKLALTNDEGIYTGFVYCADPNSSGNEFKFLKVADDRNSQIIPANMTGGIGGDFAESGENFKANAGEGVYYVELNLSSKKLTGLKVETMSIIGDFNSWGDDAIMTWNKEDFCYEATGTGATYSGWKFRVNKNWEINLGTNDDNGTLFSDLVANGKNICVSGDVIKLYPTRNTSEHIYCTIDGKTAIDDFAEPYAVLSENNTVLTFFYDDQKTAKNGMGVGPFNITYDENSKDFYIIEGREWNDHVSTIKTVVFDSSFANCTTLTSTCGWFFNDSTLVEIRGIENLKTDNVRDMSGMFNSCKSLTSLDVSNFNTSNVSSMWRLFCGCSSINSLNVGRFDTSNATNLHAMFSGCSSLTSLDVSNFNTSKVTNLSYMFFDCYSLASLDVTNFDTSNTTSTFSMFERCSKLTSLDLSHFSTEKVTDMSFMFSNCSALTSLDVSKFNTEKVTDMAYMFERCSVLTSLDVSHFSTEKVTDMSFMFSYCFALTSLDLGGFNTANVTDMSGMFLACTSLTSLDVSGFNTQQVTNMQDMFRACTNLTSLDLSRFNTQNVTEMYGMFYNCTNLKSLDLSNFDTRNVRNMDHLFRFCTNLVNLNISGFSTANVTDMGYMFEGCSSLASIQAGNAVIADSIYAQIQNPNLLLYVNEASQTPRSVRNVVVGDVAEQIVLKDTVGNNNFFCPKQFTAKRISYTHNYKQATQVGVSRGWETIALPFSVQTITHEKNGTLVPFGVDGGKPFWLRELTENGLVSARRIEAYVPYLISMPNNSIYPDDYNQAGNVTFSATDAVVAVTEQRSASGNNRTLIPTCQRVEQSASVYAINLNAAYESNPEGSIFVANYREVRPFEAYVEHPNGGARYYTLGDLAEMDVTGLQTIHNIVASDFVKVYNLSGVLVKSGKCHEVIPYLTKGVYIINGSKIVIR